MAPIADEDTAPAQPPSARRPWYLALALALAWLVGASGVLSSSLTLAMLDETPDRIGLEFDRKAGLTPEDRTRQKEAFIAYAEALHGARRRVLPLAVAELLMGGAMIVFAQRAGARKAWGRQALVQLTIVHAGLAALTWVATADLRGPEDRLGLATYKLEDTEGVAKAAHVLRLVLGAGVSAVTLLGLTRRRSLAFYAEAPEG